MVSHRKLSYTQQAQFLSRSILHGSTNLKCKLLQFHNWKASLASELHSGKTHRFYLPDSLYSCISLWNHLGFTCSHIAMKRLELFSYHKGSFSAKENFKLDKQCPEDKNVQVEQRNTSFFATRLGLIQISRFGPFGQTKCMKVPIFIQLKAIECFYDCFLSIKCHFQSILKYFQA